MVPVLAMAQTEQSKSFTISGRLKKMGDSAAWVFLYYTSGNNRMVDSVKVQKEKYQFAGSVDEPVLSRLRIKYTSASADNEQPLNMKRDLATLFLQPGKIKITSVDSFANIQVKGAPAHKEYMEFEALSKPYTDSMQALSTQYVEYRNEGNSAQMKAIENKALILQETIREDVFQQFIKDHPASPVSLLVLQQYAGQDIDVAEVEPLFNQLSPAVRSYPSAMLLKDRLDIARRTSIGQMAADFTQNDTLGNPVTLSSLRGKYVLIDFWASWCGPCRSENPNVVRAYNKYKDKGFSILGVSLDRQGAKDAWLQAIHDDGLTWTQVSDLQFWNNAVAQLYGIQSIPQNFLLDPAGKIIDKNLRGEDLERKLEELLSR